MMNTIAIIGKFCNGYEAADGQSIKTRIIAKELKESLGEENIREIDTYGWKKKPIQLMLKSVWATWCCKHVIFMTDEGGIKIFPWLLTLANIFHSCKVHYVVVGGWLIRRINEKRLRRYWLKKLYCIYVETNTMQQVLEDSGFSNVVLLPNCKRLTILSENELSYDIKEPYALCTFSRVMKEKGIQDAIEAVQKINQRFGRTIYTLDIYGQVDENQREWFERLKATFPKEIHYGGVIPYHLSTDVLRGYFALLFPTHFYTEGVPGTIIDAFASGVPVIASQWESFADIMDENTCISYPFEKDKGLIDCLEKVAMDPDLINKKRRACLKRAQMYSPECVMKILIEHLKK